MVQNITDSIFYVGANDHDLDLFEGQYIVPNGMAYNSYVIVDDKIAVFDTIDKSKTGEWLDNLAEVLGERTPDYLIVRTCLCRKISGGSCRRKQEDVQHDRTVFPGT